MRRDLYPGHEQRFPGRPDQRAGSGGEDGRCLPERPDRDAMADAITLSRQTRGRGGAAPSSPRRSRARDLDRAGRVPRPGDPGLCRADRLSGLPHHLRQLLHDRGPRAPPSSASPITATLWRDETFWAAVRNTVHLVVRRADPGRRNRPAAGARALCRRARRALPARRMVHAGAAVLCRGRDPVDVDLQL